MPAPYDYSLGNVPDPSQAFTSGLQQGNAILQLGQQRQQQQLAMQAEQQKIDQQRMQAEALQGLMNNPAAGAADYSRVMTAIPGLSEHLKRAWEVKSKDQQDSSLTDLSQWSAAIQQGQPEFAVAKMTERADAMDKAAGRATPESQALRAQAEVVKQNPQFGGVMMKSILMAHPDGKRLVDNIVALGGEDRAAAKAPLEMRKLGADATAAEADAVTKGVAAEFARPMATADLQAKAASLGLTKAQTNQAIALTKKYGAETQKVVLEMQDGNPEKRMEAEAKLRKEYTEGTKGFTEVTDAYRRVKSSQNNAVGDLSLIYGYMKMLDPGSVVREGEFATAQNATGVPQRIANIYNKVASGERLSEEQRKSFISQAGDLHETARKREAEVRGGLERVADAYKLSKPNIFGTQVVEPTAPKPPPKSAPAPAARAPIVVQW